MKVQDYKNHAKIYPSHHLIFYPISLILAIVAIYKTIKATGAMQSVWLFISLILILIIWATFMLRQHYSLTLQDRLIRIEMRHRYSMLTGKDFEAMESKLSIKQIVALRFASDEELIPLVIKAVKENLSPKLIKESITNWKGDYLRV